MYHVYDINSNRLRETVKFGDNSTILSQTLVNGFGQTVVTTIPSTVGYMYERSEYNAKNQLTKVFRDTGAYTSSTSPTLYEYDDFGNRIKTLLLDASAPTDVTRNRTVEHSVSVQHSSEGILSVASNIRYTAEGRAMRTYARRLISQ